MNELSGPVARPTPSALNGGEPTALGSASEVVTLVEGSTFCLSDRSGDIAPDSAHGVFLRDARVLSQWQLQLDGHPACPLAVLMPEAFTARFVLRRPPPRGQADSTLMMSRERLVGDGLRERITVENLGREATTALLTLHVNGDFADLFAVKEGRHNGVPAQTTVAGEHLILTSPADSERGVRITATGDPLVVPGTLTWRVIVPARDRWTAEVVVEPIVAGHRVDPGFRRGEDVEATAAARRLDAWRQASTELNVANPALAAILRRTETDLGALQIHDAEHDRSFVAAGAPWFMTLFGRDSLLTAWMVLPLHVDLAVGTLQTLASLQGRTIDPLTEEQPGRILHEVRRGPDSARVLGGNYYYGSADATPLFVMLLGECWRWGVDESVVRALLPAADAALDWVESFGDRDGDGFVEYQRATDRGLLNQGWKDSFDGINFADGTIAEAPLALCEVQAYVYGAWTARAELAEAFGEEERAAYCWGRAEKLREAFHRAFWLPDRGWYAVALDRNKRQVDALTSNAAHCLWTGLATDEAAGTLVGRLGSPDMTTGYGLRTLSSRMGAFNPMSYHNGSVWPHDTAIAVAGLFRYGHVTGAVELAQRLSDNLLHAASSFDGRLPELFCGFAREHFDAPVPYPTSCSPQAWASAAPLLLIRAALGLEPHVPGRRISLRPHLPCSWGVVKLSDLRLGGNTLGVTAHADRVTVRGLPEGWAEEGVGG